MERKIQTLGSLHAKNFFVEMDEVQGRADLAPARRLVIRHPSAVVIVPLLDPETTLLVTQYRYALGRQTLELPAGKLDPGEAPLDAARRELVEETGYQAGYFQPLLSYAPSLGYSTEIIHVFLARDLTKAETTREELEIDGVEATPLSRLKEMILAGKIIDGTTMVALAAWEWSTR